MIDKPGVAYILSQSKVTVYDKAKDTVRSIRYCANEPSIWIDEQSEHAVITPIVFRNGRLFVRQEEPNLKKYLAMHPKNGKEFRKVDVQKTVEEELTKEFELFDAVSKVRESDIQELIPVAIYFKVNTNKNSNEIRHNLLQIAKRNPSNFLNAFDSPQVKTRAVVSQAAEYQLINMKSDGCYWMDSNNLIVSTPAGMDTIDVMTRFCLTEKGSSVLSSLSEQLLKL